MQYFCLVPCGQQTCQFANGILLEHQVTFNPVEHVVDMVPCWVVVFMRTKGNIICTLKGKMNGNDKPPAKERKKKVPFKDKCKCLSNLKCTTTLQSDFKRNPWSQFYFFTFLGWNISCPVFRPVLWIFLTSGSCDFNKIYLQEKSKENSSLLIEININSKSAKETMKNHLRKLHV